MLKKVLIYVATFNFQQDVVHYFKCSTRKFHEVRYASESLLYGKKWFSGLIFVRRIEGLPVQIPLMAMVMGQTLYKRFLMAFKLKMIAAGGLTSAN